MAFSSPFVLLFSPSALPFLACALPFLPYLHTGQMENNSMYQMENTCMYLHSRPSSEQTHCKYFCILCRQSACDLKSYLKAILRQSRSNYYQETSHPSKYKDFLYFYLLMPKYWNCSSHCLSHLQTYSFPNSCLSCLSCLPCLEHNWIEAAHHHHQHHMAPSGILSHIARQRQGLHAYNLSNTMVLEIRGMGTK